MALATGVTSPVRLDSSLAVWPFDDFGIHRELGARLDQQAHAPAQLLHLHLAFLAPLVEHRGDLGRVAEQRTNLPLGAPERKALQRAGKREEEQQRRAFPPGADAGAAERRRPA